MTSTQLPADAAAHQATRQHPYALMRQPILDGKRAVHGYELLDDSGEGGAILDSLEQALVLADKRLLFIHAPADLLLNPVLLEAQPANIVLQAAALPGDSPDEIAAFLPVLEKLRKHGFKLGFDHHVLQSDYASWLALAAYIRIDLSRIQPALVERVVRFARRQSTASLIASEIETLAQFDEMSALGFTLFQGGWFAKRAPVMAQAMKPAQATVIQLINLLRAEADAAEIEQLLKRDPSLSFNLLRFINTSGMGLSCEITSLRHAILILGQKRLFRWAALLMTMSRSGNAAPAVATTAVVRGRLMELLAAELLPPEDCDNAFVAGVFSLLGSMLEMKLEDALSAIALPHPVLDALVHRRGLFAPFLCLVEACESGDDAAFARSADDLQLSSRQVNWAHLNALAWAEDLALAA
jgi:c-di-GMP-related signal transduction protein